MEQKEDRCEEDWFQHGAEIQRSLREKQEGNGPLEQRATMVSNCCMEGDLVEEGELWGKVFRN